MNGNGVQSSAAIARRRLPHNVDAEASVLGGIFVKSDALEQLPTLETDDFYHLPHKVVFQAMRNLQASGRSIDVVTVESEIEKVGKLDAVGGIAFLGELTLRVPIADNVVEYARLVQQDARNRRAILAMSSALERAQNWGHDPHEMISEILGELQRLDRAGQAPAKRLKLISVGQALDDLATLAQAPIYPTPFPALNEAIGFGGLLGTQVYNLAAGTGRGKTTWVAELAAYAAQTVPVLVVSYEMKPGYFVARKAAGVLGVHSNDILRGEVAMGRVLAAMPYAGMYLMHRPTLAELEEAVHFLKEKHGIAPLVIADYIQKLADLIAETMQRPDLRLATSQASATLCRIAEDTGAAIVAVSAIGRGKGKVLQNPRKYAPYELVEVAKESGAVEYDGAAMIVLTLDDELDGDGERIATMTLAKARFGVECHIDARYNGRRGMWRSLERVDRSDAVETPAPREEERDEAIRALIVAELQKRPYASKTDLLGRIRGCRKTSARAAYDGMFSEGLIAKVGGYLTLITTRQTELEVTP